MAESLLPQPVTAVHMKVFQGGGATGGGGTESLLPQPPHAAPMYEFKGGGKGDPVHPFRGVTLENTMKNPTLKDKAIILEFTVPDTADTLEVTLEDEIPVVPVIREKGGKTFVYKKGLVVKEKEPKDLFFYGVKGGELTQENIQDLFDTEQIKRLLVFTSTLLKPSEKQVFTEVNEDELKTVEVYQESREEQPLENTNTNTNTNSSSKAKEIIEAPTVKLSSGYRVRYVTDEIKNDIVNLNFTPMERELFDRILHFNHEFIKKYIKASPDEFYKFWKLYINKDGTSKFVLMTNKEGREIQEYLQNILEAYRKELQDKTLYFLRKQDSDITFEDYEKERDADTPFFSAPKPAEVETPAAKPGEVETPAAKPGEEETPNVEDEKKSEDSNNEDIFTNNNYNLLWDEFIDGTDQTSIKPILQGLENIPEIATYANLVKNKYIKNGTSIFNLNNDIYSSKISIETFYKKINENQAEKPKEERIVNIIDMLKLLIRVRYQQVEPAIQKQFIDIIKGFGKDPIEKNIIDIYINEGHERVKEFMSQQKVLLKKKKTAKKPETPAKKPETNTKFNPKTSQTFLISQLSTSDTQRNPSDEEVEQFKKDIVNLLKFINSDKTFESLNINNDKIKRQTLRELNAYYMGILNSQKPGVPFPELSGGSRRRRITPRNSKSVSKRQSRKSGKVRLG